jgi:hypothetical protein
MLKLLMILIVVVMLAMASANLGSTIEGMRGGRRGGGRGGRRGGGMMGGRRGGGMMGGVVRRARGMGPGRGGRGGRIGRGSPPRRGYAGRDGCGQGGCPRMRRQRVYRNAESTPWIGVSNPIWYPWYYTPCKEGCITTGNGGYGCPYPGNGYNQCQFAEDCSGCASWW